MKHYFTTHRKFVPLLLVAFICFILVIGLLGVVQPRQPVTATEKDNERYWLLLHRKSNREFLYKGNPGNMNESILVKTFVVKTGIPGDKPTPLPKLLGREYWNIVAKYKVDDNPEIAPYFLTLDIPYSDEYPYGPTPYEECKGQCDWELPGSFGLHGVAGDKTRLLSENLGSSGCIRHSDEDISYLYTLFNPEKERIRYYIEDI